MILSSSHGADKGAQVAKVILWYYPLLFEVAMHFLAMSQPGHVLYPVDRVFERSAVVFVIILGGGKFGAKSNCFLCSIFTKWRLGLDKITEGFQLIAGNVSLGKTGVWLILSAAIIFIGQFSLYFEMTKGNAITLSKMKADPSKRYCRRVLSWILLQLVYHASLIIMLQGEYFCFWDI